MYIQETFQPNSLVCFTLTARPKISFAGGLLNFNKNGKE
jgi:hypothetical protein